MTSTILFSHQRRLIPTVVFAAALAFAGAALEHPVVAGAEPQEWDIEAYDNCMKKTVRDPELCCVLSGGIVGRVPGSCTAPAAVADDPAAGSAPTNGRRTTQVPVPAQPTFQAPQAPAVESG